MARKLSYSYEVKSELTRVYGRTQNLLCAELAAMIEVGALMIDGRLEFSNPNAAVARKVVSLTKKIFNNAKIEVAAVRTKISNKAMKYAVRIFLTSETERFFGESFSTKYFDKVLTSPSLGAAYLRGAFLAGGSVNRPEKRNHLEIIFATEQSAEFVKNIFKMFDLPANHYLRGENFIVYMKEGDSICEFLGIIGVENSLDRFEVARNVKEVRAMVNRIVNCETANLNKTIDAAQRQIDDIKLIRKYKPNLEDYLIDTMKFRLKNPDDTTAELAAKLFVSKQGLLYRFRALHNLAEAFRYMEYVERLKKMNLLKGKKVGVSPEEKSLPYYKYFERDLAKIPDEKLALIDEPSKIPAVTFDEKNLYLAGDDGDCCQVGYGLFDDGTGFVCNETYMPKVKGEMLDWWFAWHSVGSDLRYKIWDAEDHYFARADNVDYVCNEKIPVNQKTWGVTHYILEDVGFGASLIELHFKRPSDFGFDEKIIGSEKCQSLVCGVGKGACAAAMCHKWYQHKKGVMFCSRFWIGYTEVDGKIIKILPEGAKVPLEVVRGLYAHNIKEFTNLAAILSEVYAENKHNF